MGDLTFLEKRHKPVDETPHADGHHIHRAGFQDPRGLARFDELPERVIPVALYGRIQPFVEHPVALGREGGDQSLFVGKMRVGVGMADPGSAGHFPQAQTVDALFRQNLRTRFDQGIFQIAVVILLLDDVKIPSYNLYSV